MALAESDSAKATVQSHKERLSSELTTFQSENEQARRRNLSLSSELLELRTQSQKDAVDLREASVEQVEALQAKHAQTVRDLAEKSDKREAAIRGSLRKSEEMSRRRRKLTEQVRTSLHLSVGTSRQMKASCELHRSSVS